MGNLSKIVEDLPEGFAYVLLAGAGNMLVNIWMSINVGRARKKYGVKYPQMYHEEPNHIFNCIQRVHQNTCEANPNFYFLLSTCGLQYPKFAATTGLIYLIGRILYAKGYYTGEPSKRLYGGFGSFAVLALLGGTIAMCLNMLKVWPYN